LSVGTFPARADEVSSPWQSIPAQAEAVVHIPRPQAIVDAIYGHELFPAWRQFQLVQDYLDSTKVRQLFQLVSYFEKELGHDRLELLDRLAGDGILIAGRFSDPKAVVVIIRGKDEALLKRFVQLGVEVIDKEIARQEGKGKVTRGKIGGVETWQFDKAHLAIVGKDLIAASEGKLLEKVLELRQKPTKDTIAANPRFQEAVKQRPDASPLVWAWLDWEQIRKIPAVKNGLDPIGGDPLTFLLFGGVADVLKRSPWLAFTLAAEGKNLRVSLNMPRGREGAAPILATHMPQDDKGSLPLLKPPRTISSSSFYLDLGRFWPNLDKFFSKEDLAELNKNEKFIAAFLGGNKLSDVFNKVGRHHRVVTALPSASPYKIKPKTPISAFAVTVELRDPAFGKTVGTLVRSGALVSTLTLGMKMKEEEYKGQKMTAYYFSETAKVAADTDNLRFNFTPCFSQVGDQFLVSSTVELGKDMIDELLKENRSSAQAASVRAHVYSGPAADSLRDSADQIVTQLILSQGVSLETAKQEMQRLTDLVRRMGQGEIDIRYGRNDFRLSALWRYQN